MYKVLPVAGVMLSLLLPASGQNASEDNPISLLEKAHKQEQAVTTGRVRVSVEIERLGRSIENTQKFEKYLRDNGVTSENAAEMAKARLKSGRGTDQQSIRFDNRSQVYCVDGKRENDTPYQTYLSPQMWHHIAFGPLGADKERSCEVFIQPSRPPLLIWESLWMLRPWEAMLVEAAKSDFQILERNPDGMTVLVRTIPDGKSKRQEKFWIDTQHGYTLSRWQNIKEDQVTVELTCTYTRHEGDIYYPSKVVETRFYYDSDGKQKVGDRFTSKVESVELNVPLTEQELSVGKIPVGAYVQDERKKPSRTYRQPKG